MNFALSPARSGISPRSMVPSWFGRQVLLPPPGPPVAPLPPLALPPPPVSAPPCPCAPEPPAPPSPGVTGTQVPSERHMPDAQSAPT
jgi:hypothetical protein